MAGRSQSSLAQLSGLEQGALTTRQDTVGLVGEDMANPDHTLFGYELPFPKQDLFVSLIAVASFIPAVVVINALVHGLLNLLGVRKAKQA